MTNENPKIEIIYRHPFADRRRTVTCVDGKMYCGSHQVGKKDGTLFSYNGQKRFEYVY